MRLGRAQSRGWGRGRRLGTPPQRTARRGGRRPRPPSPPKTPASAGGRARPSVAVLHFGNTTGDQSLDCMRTGIPDMVVTDLSQSPQVEVVSTEHLSDIRTRALPRSPCRVRTCRRARPGQQRRLHRQSEGADSEWRRLLYTGTAFRACASHVNDRRSRTAITPRMHGSEALNPISSSDTGFWRDLTQSRKLRACAIVWGSFW